MTSGGWVQFLFKSFAEIFLYDKFHPEKIKVRGPTVVTEIGIGDLFWYSPIKTFNCRYNMTDVENIFAFRQIFHHFGQNHL